MGNKAVDARLLAAEEPSDRSPVAVQPQRTAVSPPPARARRAPTVGTALRLEAPWLRRIMCACARVHMTVAYCTMIASIHQ